MEPVLQAVLRLETKVDGVVSNLGELRTDHAVLNQKFMAHDAAEMEFRRKRWQIVLALVGAVGAAWAPSLWHIIHG